MKKVLCILIIAAVMIICIPVHAQCITYNLPADTYTLPCGTSCVSPTVTPPIYNNATQYKAEAVSYMPYNAMDNTYTLLPSITSTNNKYSPVINLPFAIHIYNKNYNKIVIGSNGIVTMDTTLANCTNSPVTTINNVAQLLPYVSNSNCTPVNVLNYPAPSI